MWDRKELKAKGKAAYRANRVMCIIAALLLMIASGAGGAGSAGSSWSNIQKNIDNNSNYSQDAEDLFEDIGDYGDDYYDGSIDYGTEEFSNNSSLIAPAIIAVIVVVVLIAVAFGTADQKTSLSKNNIGLAFNENYIKVVGSMFTTGLFTALWCLLLIFPGIYKAYCWRLVPYIISENPTIKGDEARKQSAMMMNGNKWASFVLDLSFLGWKILGAFTLGILNIVFTNPYQAATNAELYLTLSGRPSELAVPAESVKEEAPEVEFEFDQEGVNE